jgi:TRAP-type C4-dicarboxylate transport system permease small subunit
VIRTLRLAADAVACLMFVAVFTIFCIKIAARYGAHAAMAWADEVSIILFIWIVFWAASFILAEREHIRFDLIYHAMPPAVRRGMAIARALLIGGLFLYAAPATLGYIQFLWRERTPVLELRLDWVYAIFGVFVVTVPIRSAWAITRLLGRDWRSRL